MLSGIGPADTLRAHGIDVVADLPGVGANLSDHPIGGALYSAARPMPEGVNNHTELVAAVRTDPALPAPDIQLLFGDLPFAPPGVVGPRNGFAICCVLLAPYSRGSVTLVSSDPETAPSIDPRLLTDERDVVGMLDGLRAARQIGGSRALAGWREEEVLPGGAVNDIEELRGFLRMSVGTQFHPVGTCRMGTDATSVVDLRLGVSGIDGLRVADASVMPSLPAANTNAAVLAIAERAADIISGSLGNSPYLEACSPANRPTLLNPQRCAIDATVVREGSAARSSSCACRSRTIRT
jgi:choline dehydrogenase